MMAHKTLHRRDSDKLVFVVPAQASTQESRAEALSSPDWIPTFAGMFMHLRAPSTMKTESGETPFSEE